MRWLCSIILAGVIIPTAAEAATINYNEAVDGDLASQPSVSGELNVFTLGIGKNTFNGEVTFSSQVDDMNNNLSDYDSIAFKLPFETKLTSILIDTSLLPGGFGREFSDTRYELSAAPGINSSFGDLIAAVAVPIPSTNLSLLDPVLPLNSGSYYFRNNAFGSRADSSNQSNEYSRTAAYTVSFNVESKPVPEPSSTLGLLAIGSLGAFCVFNRKVKHNLTN